jgi:predicted dithiol-disulfide oxidoreductase (DUF899 family)
MVEVDGAIPLIGARGAVTLLDVFEGRRMLIAYYFMWHTRAAFPIQSNLLLTAEHLSKRRLTFFSHINAPAIAAT